MSLRAILERSGKEGVGGTGGRLGEAEGDKMSSEFLKLVYGMPADLKRLKMFAKEYGVEIVKEIKQKSLSRNDLVQVHVKLPNGEYGFFTPQGGPKHGYDYQFTRSIAKNYTPDRMKQWADD